MAHSGLVWRNPRPGCWLAPAGLPRQTQAQAALHNPDADADETLRGCGLHTLHRNHLDELKLAQNLVQLAERRKCCTQQVVHIDSAVRMRSHRLAEDLAEGLAARSGQSGLEGGLRLASH
mmetsp:Transcript_5217/g.9034  ORF Transcript_5217/g.9034 Transcript_5217/m.9034 type:complete len:120 (-) Transcript_5217:55-414(-)